MGSPKSTTDVNDSTTRLKHFVEHLHGCGAGSLRPQIDEATTELGDKNTFRNQPEVQQEVPQEIPQEIPQEDSEKLSERTSKVIETLNVMEQCIKKLILGDCEVTDADCQDIAEIVKVNDPSEALDSPENTMSSKKYKITIDESVEPVEKAEDGHQQHCEVLPRRSDAP